MGEQLCTSCHQRPATTLAVFNDGGPFPVCEPCAELAPARAPLSEPLPEWERDLLMGDDPVNHPSHYTSHPSGVECITVTEHMSFNVGNAVKYLWRADEKGAPLEDLKKARWYVDREIARRQAAMS